MRRHRGLIAAIAASAMVVAACSSASGTDDIEQLLDDVDEPDRTADPEDEPADDQTSEPDEVEDDPFAIPDEIDEAYVDLVMNELLAIDSQILRDVLQREPGEELTDDDWLRIRAAFSGPQLIKAGEDYVRYATDEQARIGFLEPREDSDISWETEELAAANDTCIVAIGYYDLTDVAAEPYPRDSFAVVSLAPNHEISSTTGTVNPSIWRIHDLTQLVAAGSGEPIPREDWSRLDHGTALELTCDESDER